MPSSTLQKARLVVESARVDVLVYSEISMNSMAYFLLFSRLSRRTAIFWGHAVTSGVSQFDTDSTEGTGGGDYFISQHCSSRAMAARTYYVGAAVLMQYDNEVPTAGQAPSIAPDRGSYYQALPA